MKTIGFVDYYISEWHANNYPIWIKEVTDKTGDDIAIKYAWAEEYVSPVDGRNTDEWCDEFGVEKCETIEELCEKCDYILVLAPSNPEKHLEYAKTVLKYGKNTYIDKTFASSYEEAKEIFDIAEKYGTKFFSTSALRYSEELEEFAGVKNVVTTGGGGSLEEYIIHQLEMVVKVVGEAPKAVNVQKQGSQYICSVSFENKKNAVMVYAPTAPFTMNGDFGDGKALYHEMKSDYFKNLIADILRFYKTGEISFDTSCTLDIMTIRDGILKAATEL